MMLVASRPGPHCDSKAVQHLFFPQTHRIIPVHKHPRHTEKSEKRQPNVPELDVQVESCSAFSEVEGCSALLDCFGTQEDPLHVEGCSALLGV